MKQASKKKSSWMDVKPRLAELERSDLLDVIHDLYDANKDNKLFLHTRFTPADEPLEPYKAVIDRWMLPDIMRDQNYSVSNAKKAISDYKKALGDPEGMAELAVFYCECCRDLLSCMCVDDEAYFNALGSMYEQALKAMQSVDTGKREHFVLRLIAVKNAAYEWGWGAWDEMTALLGEYGYPIE